MLAAIRHASRHLARRLVERVPAYFPPEKLRIFEETGGVGVAVSRLPFDHLLFTGSGTTGRDRWRSIRSATVGRPSTG